MTALHPGSLERDGDTATRSTPLHKYLARPPTNTALGTSFHPRMARFLWLVVVQHMQHGH